MGQTQSLITQEDLEEYQVRDIGRSRAPVARVAASCDVFSDSRCQLATSAHRARHCEVHLRVSSQPSMYLLITTNVDVDARCSIQDCTFFSKKEIIHVHKRFTQLTEGVGEINGVGGVSSMYSQPSCLVRRTARAFFTACTHTHIHTHTHTHSHTRARLPAH